MTHLLTWFALASSFVLFVLLLVAVMYSRKQLTLLRQKLQQHQQQQTMFDKQLTELREQIATGHTQLHRQQNKFLEYAQQLQAVTTQQQQMVTALHNQQQQLDKQQEQPQNPLYQRASKLAADGATIEDLMQECELPRAEAELLINLHK